MRCPSSAGFTYIEVIISIFLIGILLVASAALARGIPLSEDARDQDLAVRIADNKLQAVRAGGYAGVPASGVFSDSDLSALASSSANIAVSDYNAKTKQVDVTVSWRNREGVMRSFTETTLLAQTGGLP